eukprot:7324901-Prymnesium_polylepis.1
MGGHMGARGSDLGDVRLVSGRQVGQRAVERQLTRRHQQAEQQLQRRQVEPRRRVQRPRAATRL